MGRPDLRHARARLGRTLATVLGGVLVVPVLIAAPAQAALLTKPIDPFMSGAGQITSTASGLVCNNAAATSLTKVACQSGLSVTELLGLSKVTLMPMPSTGWSFEGWKDCPKLDGTNCVVDGSLLGSILTPSVSPTAVFGPICENAPVPLPGLCDGGADTTAPDTRILTQPAATTAETSASFTYKAVEADGKDTTGATFECELTGPGQTAGFSDCSRQPKTYGPLEPGKYTFSVKASDNAAPSKNTDATPATHSWEITAATGAPQTSLAEKPGRWLLSRSTTISLFAGDASSYTCTLDGRAVGCSGGFAVLRKLTSGTHTFTGAAANAAGADATPARAVFTVPVNNTSLKHAKGFAKKRGSGHFLNTYSLAKRKGATLSGSAKNIKRVSLVVTKGKGYGTVKVFLGKKLLKKVTLASARTQGKRVIEVASFSQRKKGTLRIVSTSKKPVVIEGVGIASR